MPHTPALRWFSTCANTDCFVRCSPLSDACKAQSYEKYVRIEGGDTTGLQASRFKNLLQLPPFCTPPVKTPLSLELGGLLSDSHVHFSPAAACTPAGAAPHRCPTASTSEVQSFAPMLPQAAIRTARPGTMIELLPGTYDRQPGFNLTVTRRHGALDATFFP